LAPVKGTGPTRVGSLIESLNKYPEIFTGAGAEGENPDACDLVGTLGTGYSR